MSRDGSGNYSLPLSDVVADTTILASWANTTLADVAAALTASIAKDGQTNPTADLPMNSQKHTGVAAATALTNYLDVQTAMDGTPWELTGVAGTDTITATAPFSLAAYAAGQKFHFVAAATNTGAVTINLNSIGAKSITKEGTTALAAGDILINQVVEIVYDGTQFQLVSALPTAQYSNAVGIIFPSNAEIVYAGPSTPSGWTVQSVANHAIQLESTLQAQGTTGGTVDFETAFASQAVTGTNATENSHTHGAGSYAASASASGTFTTTVAAGSNVIFFNHTHPISGTSSAGSAHGHTFTGDAIDLDVKFQSMCVIRKT